MSFPSHCWAYKSVCRRLYALAGLPSPCQGASAPLQFASSAIVEFGHTSNGWLVVLQNTACSALSGRQWCNTGHRLWCMLGRHWARRTHCQLLVLVSLQFWTDHLILPVHPRVRQNRSQKQASLTARQINYFVASCLSPHLYACDVSCARTEIPYRNALHIGNRPTASYKILTIRGHPPWVMKHKFLEPVFVPDTIFLSQRGASEPQSFQKLVRYFLHEKDRNILLLELHYSHSVPAECLR